MKKPEISVIIPAYNAENIIGKCLESLQKQSIPKSKYEIIVVDDGSKDTSAIVAQSYGVRVLGKKNGGAASARNKGMRYAKGKYIAFTDSDCVIHKDWLKNLLRKYKTSSADAIAGEIYPYKPRTLAQKYAAYRRIDTKITLSRKRKGAIGYIRTGNFSVKRETIKKIGYFDERFPGCGGEDDDFTWRIHFAGYKIAVAPRAIIYHNDRDTLKGLFKQTFRNGMALTLLIHKYSERFGSRTFVNPKSLFSLPYYIVTAPFKMLFYKPGNKLFPVIDIVNTAYKLAGRINGSFKNKVIVL